MALAATHILLGLPGAFSVSVPADDGGGGATLLWDANPFAGTYAIAGSSATASDIFGENLNWDDFNPASLVVGVGLTAVAVAASPVFVGAALAAVVGGASYVIDITLPITQAARTYLDLFDDPDYAAEIEMQPIVGDPSVLSTPAGSGSLGDPVAAGDHTIRLTLAVDKAAISFDGGEAVVKTCSPTTPNLVGLGIANNDTVVYKRIRAYAQVADVDLPTLGS